MDSLLASYASSDEEEDQQENQPPPPPPRNNNSAESLQSHQPPSSLLSSLPKPQASSSLSFSLPPAKSRPSIPQITPKPTSSSPPTSLNHGQTDKEELGFPRDSNSGSKASSGLFSMMPAPKSLSNLSPISSSSGSGSASHKRVVQFRPPVIQSSFLKSEDKDDDDEDDDEEFEKKKPQVTNPNSSLKSFISSMPAPKNSATLGTLSGSGGFGRREIVETPVPSLNSDVYKAEKEVDVDSNARSVQDSSNDGQVSGTSGVAEGQLGGGVVAGGDVANWAQPSQSYVGYEGYENYANYGGCANYGSYGNDGGYDQNNWANAPSTWYTPMASGSGTVEGVARVSGKRGRDQMPTEIVEVNQDELMKNRPREDQVKLTGIAFGPAYQVFVHESMLHLQNGLYKDRGFWNSRAMD